jgi:hypothetical protein
MDPITIGLMLAAQAVNMYGQNRALKKQQGQAVQAQQRQLAAQNQATDVAMKQVQEFDPNTRTQNQQAIAQDLTGQFDRAASQPITTQGVEVGKTIEGGTTDYLTAKGKEQAKSAESLRNLAQLMGRTGSAGQLRRNESVGFGDAAGQIGRIQTGANNIAGIDQIGVQAAGQQSIGSQLLAAGLNAYGMGQAGTVPSTPGAQFILGSAALGANPAARTGLGLRGSWAG